jgi:hypothetical protein
MPGSTTVVIVCKGWTVSKGQHWLIRRGVWGMGQMVGQCQDRIHIDGSIIKG